MLNYEYLDKHGTLVGDYTHRAILIKKDGELIANALDVTCPKGAITIRVFNYLAKWESEIRKLFNLRGVTLTFDEPIN